MRNLKENAALEVYYFLEKKKIIHNVNIKVLICSLRGKI